MTGADRVGVVVEKGEHRVGDLQGVDGMQGNTLGTRPRGQPGVVTATEQNEDGWRVVELVLELPAQPQPAGRGGLSVEQCEVDATGVAAVNHLFTRRRLDKLYLEVRTRPRPESHSDPFANACVA